jgi:hypothetical protein
MLQINGGMHHDHRPHRLSCNLHLPHPRRTSPRCEREALAGLGVGEVEGMSARYPCDFYDDEWGRIHQGHGLSRYALFKDLSERFPQPPNSRMQVREVHLHEMARVKWCERHDTPCEFNGEWHRHWSGVAPGSDRSRYTQVRWIGTEHP